MNGNGILIIISGPSGSGKGTVVNNLVKRDDYSLSISATTRTPRPNEQEGVHYFFKTKDEFELMKKQNEFLEYACFCDNYYGTPKNYVEEQLKIGKNVILEIEVQGALQVKKFFPECVLVFLVAPNIDELRKRLVNRGTESNEVIQKRIDRAIQEMDFIPQYDYVIVNNSVEEAEKEIEVIVKAEKMKSFRNLNIINLFKGEI